MSFAQLNESVFLVSCDNLLLDVALPHQLQPAASSRGSAFLLGFLGKSWLVTCHHVVSSAQHIRVALSNQGLSKAQAVSLLAACPLLDIALLSFVEASSTVLQPQDLPETFQKIIPGTDFS